MLPRHKEAVGFFLLQMHGCDSFESSQGRNFTKGKYKMPSTSYATINSTLTLQVFLLVKL
jgi:hypothetical protein